MMIHKIFFHIFFCFLTLPVFASYDSRDRDRSLVREELAAGAGEVRDERRREQNAIDATRKDMKTSVRDFLKDRRTFTRMEEFTGRKITVPNIRDFLDRGDTFADLANATELEGDHRLIPLLAMRIPGEQPFSVKALKITIRDDSWGYHNHNVAAAFARMTNLVSLHIVRPHVEDLNYATDTFNPDKSLPAHPILPKLRLLRLEGLRIDPVDGVIKFAIALERLNNLTVLVLESNDAFNSLNLGIGGMKILAEALGKLTKLKRLKFSGASIDRFGDADLIALTSALRNMRDLIELDLSMSPDKGKLTTKGMRALVEIFPLLPKLKRVNLEGHEILPDAQRILEEAVRKLPGLQISIDDPNAELFSGGTLIIEGGRAAVDRGTAREEAAGGGGRGGADAA